MQELLLQLTELQESLSFGVATTHLLTADGANRGEADE